MNIEYKNESYTIDNVSVSNLAETYGTPCFVYSEDSISKNYNEINNAFSNNKKKVYYSVKANSNLSILKLLSELGSGFDIVSMGELDRVLKIGASPKNIVYSGVGKSESDIKKSIELGIYCINVESFSELERINKIASQLKTKAPVAIRVNPNIDPGSHEYISTGLESTKFGINLKNMMDAFMYADKENFIDLIGIDYHIGSQIETLGPFIEAVFSVAKIIKELKANNISVDLIDMGGGLGIDYGKNKVPLLKEYGEALNKAIKDNKLEDYNIILELGRSIVGNAGYLLTKVEYIKKDSEKNYVIVDAGMDNLIRPALYSAWHNIICTKTHENKKKILCDVVGPVCECADFLGKDRELIVEQDDILVVTACGAYASSMASNYNSRPKPAEIIIKNKEAKLISKREEVKDLYAREIII
ncbi:MAG: diaminopimelate decarboxylase [Gammaproteobacteria bacterium]|jgi:diaminopimelate decarboxylase|nr:diaminopimelate decarboxylase [Gammaproteobacteria bacterium]